MKNLIQAVLRLLGKANVTDLDGDGKIESLSKEIVGLLSQFETIRNTIDKANLQLQEVIEEEKFAQEVERDQLERIIQEANERLAKSDEVINKANAQIGKNDKINEKVKEFIL